MPETLKPCPFCGGDAIVHSDFRDRGLWTVSCKSRLECYAIEDYYPSQEEAISAWNMRVNRLESLRSCPFCGGKAKVYSISRHIWRAACDARVNCCYLAADWKTPEEAIAAWNRRTITERELESAMESAKEEGQECGKYAGVFGRYRTG